MLKAENGADALKAAGTFVKGNTDEDKIKELLNDADKEVLKIGIKAKFEQHGDLKEKLATKEGLAIASSEDQV